MVALLDVNVLVAYWCRSTSITAGRWTGSRLMALSTAGLRARFTELGVIRVCAQLPGGTWQPEATAGGLLVLTASSPVHFWWPDAVSPVVLKEVQSATTGKQVTDRYLLGLARRNGGHVATFDRALAIFGGDDVICLLPAHK